MEAKSEASLYGNSLRTPTAPVLSANCNSISRVRLVGKMENYLYHETQRIGEIVIVGPPGSAKYEFISSLCKDVVITDQDVIFGRLPVNRDILLFLYGVGYNGKNFDFAWDLIAPKMLGCIILFDWYNQQSYEGASRILDFLTQQFSAPLVLAADVRSNPYPIKEDMFKAGISLAPHVDFFFYRSSDANGIRRATVSVLDTLIEAAS